MANDPAPLATLPLWADGAPGALGAAPEDQPKLTVYLPDGPGPFAAVVVCPGGGYCMRADHEGEPIARWLNSLGIAGIVCDYRVSPYRHPIPLGDAQRAIRMTRANAAKWKIDPARVGILGFSAGGHLATSAATIYDDGNPSAPDPIDRQPCRPDALIACYAVITFSQHRHHGSMTNLLGSDPDQDQRDYLSLENRVNEKTPPTFLWHTADDTAVPVENSLWLAAALSKHKVPFALHVFPKGSHGLGLAADVPTVASWTTQCATWLKDLGFAK